MFSKIKRYLYRSLSMENYLRLLQRSFLLLYRSGLLKRDRRFDNHYYIRHVVKKGDTAIDIGANLGYYSIPLSRLVGKSGKVYSVEPIEIYNKVFLKAARRKCNITLMPYALGTEEGSVTLVSSPRTGYLNTGLPHIYDPENDGKIDEQEFAFEARMKVPSKLFAGLDRIDFIKCDIEGYEYFVLSDMKALIEKHRPTVQVEIWEQNEQPLHEMFTGMGYRAYRLEKGKLTPVEACSPDNKADVIFIFDK